MIGKANWAPLSMPLRPAAEPLMTLHDVCMAWDGRTVLEDINLEIDRGDFVAVTGPNGGGKTTLLRIMLGLLKPTGGTVTRPPKEVRIGYLPQKNMIDHRFPITVRQVIESGLLGIDGLDKAARSGLCATQLDRMGLAAHSDRPIGDLSGGQLQRALLGRALISNPRLLVLDEPLSYIDKRFEHRLYQIIEGVARTSTIVLVSHEMSTIATMANKHCIVDRTLHLCHSAHHYAATCETD